MHNALYVSSCDSLSFYTSFICLLVNLVASKVSSLRYYATHGKGVIDCTSRVMKLVLILSRCLTGRRSELIEIFISVWN